MTKKIIVLALLVALVAALAGPASAKKKKKKLPKPYKSEVVSIQLAHPVFNGDTETVVGITAQEFIQACAIPSSNGLDAYVWEVPAGYAGVPATITAMGSEPAIDYDLDIYLFDSGCSIIGAFNSESVDEFGVLLPDTAFILVHNYLNGPVSAQFELTPS